MGHFRAPYSEAMRSKRDVHSRMRFVLWVFAGGVSIGLNAQPGAIDASMGANGVLVMPHPDDWIVHGYSLALDGEARYLVAGGHGSIGDHYLARVLSDGSVDASFGASGHTSHALSNGADWAADVVTLPDGRFVTVGSAGDSLCIARFLPNGELDASFGTGGITRVGDASGVSWGNSIVRRPDGRLVAAGRISNDFGVVQFTGDGLLDASFGIGGVVTIAEPSEFDMANALALRPDGTVIAAGRIGDGSASEILVAQFLTDGTPDPDFGVNGQLRMDPTPFADMANDIVLAPNGDAIICGAEASNAFFARIATDGELDGSFGDLGVAIPNLLGDSTVWLSSLVLQSDGRIVGVGSVRVDQLGQLAVVRVLADGSRDVGFGVNGFAVYDVPEADGEGFYDLAFTLEGTIVACGTAQYNGEDRAIIARFWSGLEVGVFESSEESARLSVHPVPVDDHATITLGPGTQGPVHVEVVDGLGQVVQVLSSAATSRQVVLSTSGLMDGVYFIRCWIGAVRSDVRIVVNH